MNIKSLNSDRRLRRWFSVALLAGLPGLAGASPLADVSASGGAAPQIAKNGEAPGFLAGGWYGSSEPSNAPEASTVTFANDLQLSSSGIENGFIGERYSCFGGDASLPISWTLETSEAIDSAAAGIRADSIKSYVLTMIDQSGVAYWSVYNIGTNASGLEEGLPKSAFYNGIYQGKNDSLVNGYTGPCPVNSELQTYYLSLLALDSQLSFPDLTNVTYQDISSAVAGHVLLAADTSAFFVNDGSLGQAPEFTLESRDFSNNGMIPQQFTCDGNDVSPQLFWSGAPEDVVSFALLVTDTAPDAGANYSSWVVYNLPARRAGINRGVPEDVQPGVDHPEFYQGLTTRVLGSTGTTARFGYLGPCPPAYDGIHQYKFELLALDTELTFSNPNTVTDQAVRAAALDHVLGQTELLGNYERQEGGGTGVFTLTSPDFVDGANLPQDTKSDFDGSTAGYQCATAPVDVDVTYIVPCEDPEETETCYAPGFYVNLHAAGTSGESPALEWTGVPAGTQSFALLATDADVIGSGTTDQNNNFSAHWVAYNIPPTMNTLDKDQPKNFFTNGYFNAFNDIWWRDTDRSIDKPLGDGVLDQREDVGYWGACAAGNRMVFNLVALDTELDFSGVETVTYNHVVNAIRGHIIDTATLSGRVP
jgi:hypothetical protein